QGYIAIDGLDDGKAVTLPLGATDAFDLRWAGDGQVVMKANVVVHIPGEDPAVKTQFTRDIIIGRDVKLIGQVLGNNPAFVLTTALPIIGYGTPAAPQLTVVGADLSTNYRMGGSMTDTRLTKKEGDIVWALYRVDPSTGKGNLTERSDGTVDGW